MSISKIPYMSQEIEESVPALGNLIQDIIKMDLSSYTDLSDGALNVIYDSLGTVTIQKQVGGAWQNIVKVNIDAEKLNGYQAQVVAGAGKIPVRNSEGKIEGDITGQAKSAESASSLSEINPIATGGTGASSAAGARNNLDVPSKSDFTLVVKSVEDTVLLVQTAQSTADSAAESAQTANTAAQGAADDAWAASLAAATAQSTANSKLNLSGGTISGHLVVTGNLTVNGILSCGRLVLNGKEIQIV